jgi:hypothetical protein
MPVIDFVPLMEIVPLPTMAACASTSNERQACADNLVLLLLAFGISTATVSACRRRKRTAVQPSGCYQT